MIDANGTQVVEYYYDAWGAPISKTGTMAVTLGTVNPFRYRGYVYDEETGLYYLRSRYYNPVWKRFINADNLVGDIGSLLFHNQYAYCGNGVVKYSDNDGHAFGLSLPSWDAVSDAFIGIYNAGRESISSIATAAYRQFQQIQQQRQALKAAIRVVVEAKIDSLIPKDNSVYILFDTSESVRYVGRTNNYNRRMYQHRNDPKHPERATYSSRVVCSGLSVSEAKVMEQTLISAYGLEALDNARREIAVRNLNGFHKEMQRAAEIFGAAYDDFFGILGE